MRQGTVLDRGGSRPPGRVPYFWRSAQEGQKYGLKVYLHGIKCHREGEDSAHRSRVTRMALQASAQKRFEEVYGSREEFVKIFGKNYL